MADCNTSGVIFLTTNRLKEFDPAFESRIQFKVLYEALSDRQRSQIWKNLLPPRKVTSEDSSETTEQAWDDKLLVRLGSQYRLNGREIRNMIKNALALAKMQDEELSEEHLDTVSQINQDWIRKVEMIELGEDQCRKDT
jgi:SpoVK/Ycf46/Vps4 family AAA+-type ATPase